MKLISMTDFVLLMRDKYINKADQSDEVKAFVNCCKYAIFLKQPLELWMFVPCDEDRNVLEEPKIYSEFFSGKVWSDYSKEEIELCEQYQKAKERCLFEGARTPFDIGLIDKGIEEKATINDLAERGINWELTPTAQKQIGI